MPKVDFPTDRKRLIHAIDSAMEEIRVEMTHRSIEWDIDYWFLQGARSFNVDYRNGFVNSNIAYETVGGRLLFKWEGTLEKLQTELGRLGPLDLTPFVSPLNDSLDGQRKSAVAMVVLLNLLPPKVLNAAQEKAKLMALQYGTVGVLPIFESFPNGKIVIGIEILPPWEFGSIPARVNHPDEAAGIIRRRWMTFEEVKDKMAVSPNSKVPGNENDIALMRGKRLVFGHDPGNSVGPRGRSMSISQAREQESVTSTSANQDRGILYVDFQEMFLKGLDGSLSRYVAKAGDWVFEDITFGDKKFFEEFGDDTPPPPWTFGVGGYHQVGSFYYRSFVAPLVPLNARAEKNIESAFKNVEDFTSMGKLGIIGGAGINVRSLKAQDGHGIVVIEPDSMTPMDSRPFQIQPTSAGSTPAQIAQVGVQLLDKMASQGQLIDQGSKRVSSNAGLNTLIGVGNVPLDGVGRALANAFVPAYEAILYQARIKLVGIKDKLKLTGAMDDAVAGLSVNEADSTIKLTAGIPWYNEVSVSVKNAVAEGQVNRKEELLLLLGNGLISPTEFWIIAIREGVGFTGYKKSFESAIKKASLNHITLFNDGEQPGEIIHSENSDDPNVMLFLAAEFMQRPFFGKASDEVKNAFFSYKRKFMEQLGLQIPEQLPNPEDASEQELQVLAQVQRQRAQQQQQQQQ